MNDSVVKIIKLKEGTDIENAQFCKEERNDSVFTYTPYDIIWYRYNNRLYLSKDIQLEGKTKRIFIERLVAGKISLYFYCDSNSKRFYLDRDSSYFKELTEGSKNNSIFRDTLSKYCSDCKNIDEAVKSVKYNTESLSLFIKMYNSCTYRPFPFPKFGLYLGLNRSVL